MRCEMEGEFRREGTYIYLWLIPIDVWQKPMQYCKATNFQLKKNFFKVKSESNNTLKRSYTMTKWALSQGCKDSSISANQSM